MKLSNLITIVLTATILAACGGPIDSRKNKGGGTAVTPASTTSHRASECLSINGKWSKDGNKTNIVYETTAVQNGVHLKENNLNLIIDGESHELEMNPGLSYVGVCSQNTISINVYRDNVFTGTMKYSINDKAQLSFEAKPVDVKENVINDIYEQVDAKPSVDTPTNVNETAHNVKECPVLDGQWAQVGGDRVLVFKTTSIANGIRLSGTGAGTDVAEQFVAEIDGEMHASRDNDQLMASCSKNMIFVNLYYNDIHMSVDQMSINEKGQLVIETKFSSAAFKNKIEVYNRVQN